MTFRATPAFVLFNWFFQLGYNWYWIWAAIAFDIFLYIKFEKKS